MGRAKKNDKVIQRDPFDISAHPTTAQLEWANWFAELIKDMPYEVHNRAVHYKSLGVQCRRDQERTGEPYANDKIDSNLLNNASMYARYLGIVPFNRITDNKNDGAVTHTAYGQDNIITSYKPDSVSVKVDKIYLEDIVKIYSIGNFGSVHYDVQSRQPYHIEIIVEKSTMNSILIPIANKYGATLVVLGGMDSLTQIYECYERINDLNKPVRIFYIRDFDPNGENMAKPCARMLEWFIRKNRPEMDVAVRDLLLSKEQCIKYKLPRTPIEKNNNYKRGFEEKYGEGATELDALEALYPGEFEKIVTEAIEPYYDYGLNDNINEFTWKERKRFNEVTEAARKEVIDKNSEQVTPLIEQYNELVDKINTIGSQINKIIDKDCNIHEFTPQYPEKSNQYADDINSSKFLLNTKRSYEEQLQYYYVGA